MAGATRFPTRVRAFALTLEIVQSPRWLRMICLGVWLIAGSTSFRHPSLVWMIAFIAFGVLFWLGTDRVTPRKWKVWMLLGQAALATLLDHIGMPAFEGALFALVAAQLPLTVSVWGSVAWALAQAVVLFVVLPRDYNWIEIAKSVGS